LECACQNTRNCARRYAGFFGNCSNPATNAPRNLENAANNVLRQRRTANSLSVPSSNRQSCYRPLLDESPFKFCYRHKNTKLKLRHRIRSGGIDPLAGANKADAFRRQFFNYDREMGEASSKSI